MQQGALAKCRRSKAVNVTARYSGGGRCTVDAVTIRNPMRGYDSPVGQAILFASLGRLQLYFYYGLACQQDKGSAVTLQPRYAGVPKLESISNFDYVRNEADYLVELDRWNQQVRLANMHNTGECLPDMCLLHLQAHTDPAIPKPVAFVNMHGKFSATAPAPISRYVYTRHTSISVSSLHS